MAGPSGYYVVGDIARDIQVKRNALVLGQLQTPQLCFSPVALQSTYATRLRPARLAWYRP